MVSYEEVGINYSRQMNSVVKKDSKHMCNAAR